MMVLALIPCRRRFFEPTPQCDDDDGTDDAVEVTVGSEIVEHEEIVRAHPARACRGTVAAA